MGGKVGITPLSCPVTLSSQIYTRYQAVRGAMKEMIAITSAERHNARYPRRRAARQQKKLDRVADALDFDTVFTFTRLYRSAQDCFRQMDPKVQSG